MQTQARMVAQMQAWADQHARNHPGVSHGMAIDLLSGNFGLDVRQSPRIALQTPPSTFSATRMRSGKLSRSRYRASHIPGVDSGYRRNQHDRACSRATSHYYYSQRLKLHYVDWGNTAAHHYSFSMGDAITPVTGTG